MNKIFTLTIFADPYVGGTQGSDGFYSGGNVTGNPSYGNDGFSESNNLVTTRDEAMRIENRGAYVKELLRNSKSVRVHEQFAQKKPIPKGEGKTQTWRKFSSLPVVKTPIVEGVIPAGHKRTPSYITASVFQFGDFIKHTDMTEAASFDNIVADDLIEQGDQAGRTRDELIRDIMQTTTNVMYAGGKTTRAALTIDDVITSTDVFKAVNKLKRKNIPTIDGYYVCICHTDIYTQLMLDPDWQDWQKYENSTKIFEGEVGKLGKCRFIESSNAKIYMQDVDEADDNAPDPLAVYGTLFLGANAYGITELEGMGLDYIVKQPGYKDELNLVGSTGWKMTLGGVLLDEASILRYESCSFMSADAGVEAN